MAISRMQQPRQLYGLGSLVKSIGKTVKKVVKSPIGKAAILGIGAFGYQDGAIRYEKVCIPARIFGKQVDWSSFC